MDDEAEREFSQPVRDMVATTSDEQLAWMVGPDRGFYSAEALEAAALELENRRANAPDVAERKPFNSAAFVLGPVWYFHHGMFGRGSMLVALLVGALFGLQPVAEAVGIPVTLWVILVLFGVGAYCGRYADRDLEESRIQRKLTPSKSGKPRAKGAKKPTSDDRSSENVTVAKVGCEMAGKQAKALLDAAGIKATVEPGASGNGKDADSPCRLLVPRADRDNARKLLAVLLKPAK